MAIKLREWLLQWLLPPQLRQKPLGCKFHNCFSTSSPGNVSLGLRVWGLTPSNTGFVFLSQFLSIQSPVCAWIVTATSWLLGEFKELTSVIWDQLSRVFPPLPIYFLNPFQPCSLPVPWGDHSLSNIQQLKPHWISHPLRMVPLLSLET